MNNVAKVFNMTGANSAGAAQSAVNAHNLASDAHEKKFAGKQDRIESLPEKNVLADADTLPLTDSEEQNAGKRISWANIKAMLGKLYVPMTRRINNRALSADVTLTGDDIKTSATDETSISAALSNKADATPPQEYDLPLAEGWNPYQSSAGNQWACTYSKDQFGIVRLCARLTTQNAIAATGTLIATIPAGFRPLQAFSVVCRVQLPGSGSQILTIADVDMYGQIKLFNVEANANSGTVSLVLPPCSFVAAD